MNKHKIFCLVGESGSGKTTLIKELEKDGLEVLQSYTTRLPRYENEYGHMFCSVEEYEHFKSVGQIVAYSHFNNNHYFSTKEQMYTCDLYVVDFDGVADLKKNFEGVDDIEFIVIYLQTSTLTRFERMFERGDSLEKIEERILYDHVKFASNREFDYAIDNNGSLEKTCYIVKAIIDAEQVYHLH